MPRNSGVSSLKGLLGGAAALTGLLIGAGAAQAADAVNIGVLFGLTGTASVACTESLNSVKIAVDEINKAGGVMGKPINLIVEDDEGRPPAAIQAANKLADVDKVPVVIGGYQSSTALPAGKVFNSKNVVFVVDATTNDLRTVGPYLFDVAGLADQASALIDFVHADNPSGKRLAGLFQNNPIGQDRSTVSKARAEALGMEYVHAMLYTEGQKDFRAELTKLMEAKPDAIVTDIYADDAEIIQRQLYEMGTTDFSHFYSYNLGAFGTLDPKFIEGMKGIDYATSGPRSDAFKKKYEAAYGKPFTDAWAPPFYDATWIVATAINLANSLDPEKIRDAMWPAAWTYAGVSGHGDKAFNMYGKQPTDTTHPLVYKAGKLTPYQIPGQGGGLIIFRYPDEQGTPLQFAPTKDDFAKLYPNNQ